MAQRRFGRVVLTTAAAVFVIGSICSTSLAEGFDKPVRKTILDLGSSPDQPDFPKLHIHLSCYYYPKFMVKELDDDGNKGSLRISVLRVEEAKAPSCIRELLAGERELPNYPGYFWGAKDKLIFVINDDGDGEGQFFIVYDAMTLNQTFRDALRFSTKPRFSLSVGGRSVMRYQRVFFPHCSLMKNGDICWRNVVMQTGVHSSPVPRCDGYDNDVADPSLIAFPVEVALYPKPVTKVRAGPVLCFAAQ
jgi:hypothetical protein